MLRFAHNSLIGGGRFMVPRKNLQPRWKQQLSYRYTSTMKDENCIFCKIASKEEKAYIVWESSEHIAFLSIFPNTKGVTVVIPKEHHASYAFDLPADELTKLTLAAKTVANQIDDNLPDTMRTAMVYEGFGVNHVHAKLFPLHGPKQKNWQPVKSNVDTFFTQYAGYISSHDAAQATDEELRMVQHTLTQGLLSDLSLRLFTLQDANELYTTLKNNKNWLNKRRQWVADYDQVEQAQSFIQAAIEKYQNKQAVIMGIFRDAQLAGIVSLKKSDKQIAEAFMTYWLAFEFAGRGVALAACRTLLEYGFEYLDLEKVIVSCSADDVKACAIPRKLLFAEDNIDPSHAGSQLTRFTMYKTDLPKLAAPDLATAKIKLRI